MLIKRVFSITTGAALFALCSLSANAHHGWAGNTQAIELSGTVVGNVNLSGPHGAMRIQDNEGQVWDITLAPSARTARAGLTEDVLPMGAEVTVSGMRNDNPERFEVKTRRVSWNGRNFDVYPQR